MIRLSTYFFLFIVFANFLSYGQIYDKQEGEYSLASPYHSVQTHLFYLQDDSYQPQIAARVFNLKNKEHAKELAIQLKQILDGKGLEVLMEDLPKSTDYTDSISGKARYVLFSKLPAVYLERVKNNWYYSKKTVAEIPRLHKKVFPFGIDKLLNLLPKIGHKKILTLHVWQYFGILILIFISVVLHKLLSWLFSRVLTRVMIKLGNRHIVRRVIQPIARPLSVLMIILLLMLLFPILQLPVNLYKYVVIGFKVLIPFYVILVFYRMVDVVSAFLEKLAAKTDSTLDDQLIPLLRKTLKLFVVIIGILFILQNLEVDITILLASLSIGGLAFALAAQDTIKNFFGSIMIFVDRPFQIGDLIVSEGISGTVEEVGFRSTRIRTFHNSLISIPNGRLADKTIDNLGMRVYRRFKTNISVTYDTPPDMLEAFTEGLRQIAKQHPKTRKDYYEIHLNDMADSSLNILFYIFFKVPNWSEELKARHQIILAIINLADELGIRFAFPTETIHIEDFPEKKSLTPQHKVTKQELKDKVNKFVKHLWKEKS